MADNVTVDYSTSYIVATDQVSGSQYQKVKLYVGDPDHGDPIPGDNTKGLYVDVRALPSGTIAGLTSLPTGSNTIGGVKEVPDATSSFSPTNGTSDGYEASRVIKATPGTLYGLTGYNSYASSQFIQIHDATSLPIENSLPKVVFTVTPTSNFSYSADKFGRFFTSGIVVCNSSTGPYKNIGAANCWFDAQYS